MPCRTTTTSSKTRVSLFFEKSLGSFIDDDLAVKSAAQALIDEEVRKGSAPTDDPRIPPDLEVFPVGSLVLHIGGELTDRWARSHHH